MSSPIEFEPNLTRKRGGVMTLNEALPPEEIVQHYVKWLIKEHPELDAELSYDKELNRLFVGYWIVNAADEAIAEQIDFVIWGTTEEDEASAELETPAVEEASESVDIEAFKAPVQAVLAEKTTTAPSDPIDVQAIMNSDASLKVAKVYDKATMEHAESLRKAATIQPRSTVAEFSHAGAVEEFPSSSGMQELSAQSSFIGHGHRPPPRVMITSQPERQIRPSRNFNSNENTTMGNKSRQHRDYDDNVSTRDRNKGDRRRDNRQNSSRSVLTSANAGPASAEMLSKLVNSGVGSMAQYDLSSYRSRLNSPKRPERNLVDGENCINVSAAAVTDLGKALRLTEQRPFEYPGLGRFGTLAGLYLMLIEAPADDFSYQSANSARLSKELSKGFEFKEELKAVLNMSDEQAREGARAKYDWAMIFTVMADATWVSINQDVNLVQALLSNQLPLEAYMYVPKSQSAEDKAAGKVPDKRLRYEPFGSWYLPVLVEIARTLRARLRILEEAQQQASQLTEEELAQRSAPELPLPNFDQIIDRAMERYRGRVMYDKRMREEREAEHQARMDANKAAPKPPKSERSFKKERSYPSMDPQRQREIAQEEKDKQASSDVQVADGAASAAPVASTADSVGDIASSGEVRPALSVVEGGASEAGQELIEGTPVSEVSFDKNPQSEATVVPDDVDLSATTVSKIVGVSTEPAGSVNIDQAQVAQAQVEVSGNVGSDTQPAQGQAPAENVDTSVKTDAPTDATSSGSV
jgi:hypothetical protein